MNFNTYLTEKKIVPIEKRTFKVTDIFGNEDKPESEDEGIGLHYTKIVHAQDIQEPVNDIAIGWVE